MKARRSIGSGVLALAVIIGAAAFPVSARGDEPDPVAVQAQTLKRANEKFDAGDYEGSIVLYENVLRTLGERRGFKVLFNLGLAYEAAGNITAAIDSYRAFVAAAERDPFPTAEILERKKDAEKQLARLQSTYGAIHVVTTRATPAFYRVEGGAARAAGTTVWVAPGEHSIELDTGTPSAKAQRVNVLPGQTLELRIEAPPPPPPPSSAATREPPRTPTPTPNEDRDEKSGHFPTTVLVIGVAATVVSFVVPVLLGFSAANDKTAAENAGTLSPEYRGLRDDYGSSRTLYYASYAIPGVFAIATTVAVVLSLPSSPRH